MIQDILNRYSLWFTGLMCEIADRVVTSKNTFLFLLTFDIKLLNIILGDINYEALSNGFKRI